MTTANVELATPADDTLWTVTATVDAASALAKDDEKATAALHKVLLKSPHSKACTTIPFRDDECSESEAEGMDTFMNALSALSELDPVPLQVSESSEDLLSPSVLPPIHGSVYAGSICAAIKESKSKGSSVHLPPPSFTSFPTPPNPARKRKAAQSLDGEVEKPPPMPKVDGEPRFFCKYDGCGKGYASTDAVRKHCRQRHLEWLRALGHGAPSLYCSWTCDDGTHVA